ncbi:MAG: hypothetical protein M3Z18_11155 [Gemmatimonadota bacterium]|nr:hypothetical protein [Gemmatimonadota bacterium]
MSPSSHLRRVFTTVFALAAALAASACVSQRGPGLGTEPSAIPTRYDEHRFYVTPVTTGGDTLAFILDSGIASDLLSTEVAARLRLPREPMVQGADTLWLAALPALSPAASIPAPDPAGPLQGRFLVVPLAGQGLLIARAGDAGVIGSSWLGNRVWTFDYPGRRLLLYPIGARPLPLAAHQVALGFAADAVGRRTSGLPRITVQIDGDSLDMLFDTGATMNVSDSALAALADGRPSRRAGSFVVESVFERWRRHHPEWRVIEGAEVPTGFAMIEVPQLEIGGYRVGPAWFTARRDRDYHRAMDHLMDRPVVGSLGGSALHFFAVTIDYPRAVASFARP